MLLEAALADTSSPTHSSPGSCKENYSRQWNDNQDITEKEMKQLRAVQRLMEIKGFDTMMKFLSS